MTKKILLTLLIVMGIVGLAARPAYADEDDHTRIAKTVYIYPWNCDTEIEGGEMHIKSKFDSVFQIDDTIWITDPQWYRLGERYFFIQPTNGYDWEAIFIAEIDGIPQVIQIPFSGEVVEINSRGIIYSRGGMIYYKSFYPQMSHHQNWWDFPEKQGWGCDAPSEVGGAGNEVAVKAEAPF